MAKKRSAKDQQRLRELIQEAAVDCNDQADEHMGLLTMIEENVVCPFPAKVIGEAVQVTGLEPPQAGFGLVAVCEYKGKEYRIDITSLEWTKEKPEGFEWIEAFLYWQETLF